MERKTDDQIILKMLQEGKTQKEIAEHFGVSPVAIHKRLKRLAPPPETPTFDKLTEKEQKFCIEVAKGKTQTQAAMDSYEVTTRGSAKAFSSELMSKPEIKMAINELMDYHDLTKSYRVQKLKTHVDNRDPNVSLKALDQSWKLDGSYAPEKHINVDMSYEDILKEKELIRQELERRRIERKKRLEQMVEDYKKEGMTKDEIIKKIIEIEDEIGSKTIDVEHKTIENPEDKEHGKGNNGN